MLLRRSRHVELDKLRVFDLGYCKSWFMFFGTCPPTIHPHAVHFTEDELASIRAGEMPASVREPGRVEPFDGDFRN